MFIAWGRFVALHRRAVGLAATILVILSLVAMVTVAPDLSSEGFLADDAESVKVDDTVAQTFGLGGNSLVFLFDADGAANTDAVRAQVEASIASVASDDRFRIVATGWSTGDARFFSTDDSATYAVAYVKDGVELSNDEIIEVIDGVKDAAATQGITVATGGSLAITQTISDEVEQGIIRAETIAIPITLILLILVFGSVIAAGLPLLIGALGILGGIAITFVLSQSVFQSVFAINVITMLGLGLGIDYSLFMVTRFREEIAHRSPEDAIAVTMATTGKAILFSGITVMFGLAATMFFPLPMLHSMGQAGIIVTLMALIYGTTLLPALLVTLGDRVNRFAIFRRRVGDASESAMQQGVWFRLASLVMRRPVAILLPLLVLLLVAGTPVLQLNLTPGGPEMLPEGREARVTTERLNAEFGGSSDATPVLLTFPDDALSGANAQQAHDLTTAIAALPGVTSVDSFAGTDQIDWASWTGDASSFPAELQAAIQQTVRGDQVLIQVHTDVAGRDLEQVAKDIRALSSDAVTIEVGGQAAASVDTIEGIEAGMLPAVLFVVIGAYLILLFTFGSVFLPIKAMFMSVLSISASLGVVVLIFQDGHFENLFDFTATGEIVAVLPILMFCVLFGLSMDYEVLMLSRIQEEWERTGDNTKSVAFGLASTGRVITGAAAIMVVAFGGFVLADIVIIKSLGFGLAFAVLIDATIVRGLLVPATMRLMGRWNWWSPAPIKRIVDRAGLSHHSDLSDAALGD